MLEQYATDIRNDIPKGTREQQHLWLKRNVKGTFIIKLQNSKPGMSARTAQRAWDEVVRCILLENAELEMITNSQKKKKSKMKIAPKKL
jgi:hypothetical protein